MRKFFMFGFLILTMAGCAFFKQAKEDYALGKSTPYAEGETTVQQQTQALTNTVSGIPYANLATPILAIGAPFIFFWLRGKRLRKNNEGVSSTGATADGTSFHFGVDEVLKLVGDLQRGIFEIGPDGSALKRGWKTAVLTTLGVAAVPIIQNAIPFLQAHHPAWMSGALLSLAVGGLAAAEKAVSKISQPVATIAPAGVGLPS